jgi:alpha-glucosidase (family GH31 glycosyl hydrolase)
MMTQPVWSTWAQYKADINASVVLGFGQEIAGRGFPASQLEIDDNWEACYGAATFDPVRFPDPARLVGDLKALGFRVTLWVHPFINRDCEDSYTEAASPPRMYLVRDPDGRYGSSGDWEGVVHMPGLVWWWQGFMAGNVSRCFDQVYYQVYFGRSLTRIVFEAAWTSPTLRLLHGGQRGWKG